MLVFVKRRTLQNGYGTAIVDVVFDDATDKMLHIVRHVVASNGQRHDDVNRIVMLDDVSDDVADEALAIVLNEVITR